MSICVNNSWSTHAKTKVRAGMESRHQVQHDGMVKSQKSIVDMHIVNTHKKWKYKELHKTFIYNKASYQGALVRRKTGSSSLSCTLDSLQRENLTTLGRLAHFPLLSSDTWDHFGVGIVRTRA